MMLTPKGWEGRALIVSDIPDPETRICATETPQ